MDIPNKSIGINNHTINFKPKSKLKLNLYTCLDIVEANNPEVKQNIKGKPSK